jgi:hypothetical protein
MAYQQNIVMRLCWHIFAVSFICFATPSVAEPFHGSRLLEHGQNLKMYLARVESRQANRPVTVTPIADSAPDDQEGSALPLIFVSDETKQQEPNAIVIALMSGTCGTLKIAGRDFKCRAVAFHQTEEGRANFTIALDDPNDNSHIITFSGDHGRRPQDNLYELPIDRMLLKSKDRPKVDGLPVPFVEFSTGICKQIGSFAMLQVSSISCAAIDKNGKKYELQYESDGSPIAVRRIRRMRAGSHAISPFD